MIPKSETNRSIPEFAPKGTYGKLSQIGDYYFVSKKIRAGVEQEPVCDVTAGSCLDIRIERVKPGGIIMSSAHISHTDEIVESYIILEVSGRYVIQEPANVRYMLTVINAFLLDRGIMNFRGEIKMPPAYPSSADNR